jgi:hypothetical protein
LALRVSKIATLEKAVLREEESLPPYTIKVGKLSLYYSLKFSFLIKEILLIGKT